jgi:uncharacterized protein with PIN domain
MAGSAEKLVWLLLPPAFDPLLKPAFRSTHRRGALPAPIKGTPSAKHLLEALGVPHTEVAGLRLDGEARPLSYLPQPGDHLEVIPAEAPSVLPRDFPGDSARFILDNHLGKLTTYLSILGFDCLYDPGLEDAGLAAAASRQRRILLTRDRQLLMRREVLFGCWVRSKDPVEQVRQVLERYGLHEQVRLFRRCLRCNEPLVAVPKAQVLPRLQPLTKKYYQQFQLCPACDQVYWPGSHYEHMQQLIPRLLARDAG